MATSSFTKEFIIEKPEAIDQLIEALNNPVTIKVKERDFKKQEQEGLCAIRKRLASRNS